MIFIKVGIALLKYLIQRMINFNLKLKLLTILNIMICIKKLIHLHQISEHF